MKITTENLVDSLSMLEPVVKGSKLYPMADRVSFKDNKMIACNAEVYAEVRTIMDFRGSTALKPLFVFLKAITDSEIEVDVFESRIHITYDAGVGSFPWFTETHPIPSAFDRVDDWEQTETADKVSNAFRVCAAILAKDHFRLSYVHVTASGEGSFIESTDNKQAISFPVELNFGRELLFTKMGATFIGSYDLYGYYDAGTWVMFDAGECIIAVRPVEDDYVNMDKIFCADGMEVSSTGIVDAVEKISKVGKKEDDVTIAVFNGKMSIHYSHGGILIEEGFSTDHTDDDQITVQVGHLSRLVGVSPDFFIIADKVLIASGSEYVYAIGRTR